MLPLQQVLNALKSEGLSLQQVYVFLSQAIKDVEVSFHHSRVCLSCELGHFKPELQTTSRGCC